MRTWLVFAPLIGAALFGNALTPIQSATEDAEGFTDFDRSFVDQLAAARQARAQAIAKVLSSPAAQRVRRGILALVMLLLYASVRSTSPSS